MTSPDHVDAPGAVVEQVEEPAKASVDEQKPPTVQAEKPCVDRRAYVAFFNDGVPSYIALDGTNTGKGNRYLVGLETYTIPGQATEYGLTQLRLSKAAAAQDIREDREPTLFYIGPTSGGPASVVIHAYTDGENRLGAVYYTKSGMTASSIGIEGRTSKEIMEDILKQWAAHNRFDFAAIKRTGVGVSPFIGIAGKAV
jgi:hypothetical protein